MELEASRTTTRSRNPPSRTMTAGFRKPVPGFVKWSRSGHRIPAHTTPMSSRNPQKLIHTCLIGHRDAMKMMRIRSSTMSTRASNDASQRIELSDAPLRRAKSISAAVPVDAPDARNSAPSHGLSAQIGRFVTDSRTPVYPATKNPKIPPRPATSFTHTVVARPRRSSNQERAAHPPNNKTAHAPNEIGDQLLNIRLGKFSDWNSMCQKRSGRPRSSVKRAPEMMAPQNPSA